MCHFVIAVLLPAHFDLCVREAGVGVDVERRKRVGSRHGGDVGDLAPTAGFPVIVGMLTLLSVQRQRSESPARRTFCRGLRLCAQMRRMFRF